MPLPPDPDGQNDNRAEWANIALLAMASATGCDAVIDAPQDLLCNLMHWCDRQDLNFDTLLTWARDTYKEETHHA